MTNANPVLYRIPANDKRVALTFDLAVGDKMPLRMLSLLRKNKVRQATFFVTGVWARTYPNVARRIRRAGYEVASHGYRHEDYRKRSDRWIEREVLAARIAIRESTGRTVNMIRTPGGEMNERVIRKLQSMGQTIVHWNLDSLDWRLTDVRRIVKRVVPHARPGSIILLHACDPWPQSLPATEQIIKGLRRKGYRFVSVSQPTSRSKEKSR